MGIAVSGRLILASASPRRSELLKLMGLDFDIMPGGIDEAFRPGETPREHVLRLSEEKALFVARFHPDAWVLGADTIVVIGERSSGNRDHLRRQGNARKTERPEAQGLHGIQHCRQDGGAGSARSWNRPSSSGKSPTTKWPGIRARRSPTTRREPTPFRGWAAVSSSRSAAPAQTSWASLCGGRRRPEARRGNRFFVRHYGRRR